MFPHQSKPKLPPEIRSVLRRLRRRVRRYVLFEGVALAIVWLGLTFWVGLALDYLPVLAGSGEMPRAARIVLLAIIAAVLAYILYRWILRRTLVRFRDANMAVLLERRFPEFGDSLMTAVELTGRSKEEAGLHYSMLDKARRDAVRTIEHVRLRDVFNPWPLWRTLVSAAAVLASICLFGLLAHNAFAVWTNRLYRLSDEPWPRRAHIEVLGFADRQVKVARGADFTVRVRADATRDTPPPEVCVIHYRAADGERGRVNMSKRGAPRNGFQSYTFAGKPFEGILSDIRFDVVGFDHRVRDYLIQVVDSPKVVHVDLVSTFPPYTGLLPRSESYRPGIQLPRGTQVTVVARTNKPLRSVQISGDDQTVSQEIAFDGTPPEEKQQFTFDIAALGRDVLVEIQLHDDDGVTSQQPYRLLITAIEDQAPVVGVRLSSIGSAITPDARLPIVGEITDDFGVDHVSFVVETDGGNSREFPIAFVEGEPVDSALDLRQQRTESDDPLQLEVEQNIVVSVRAVDGYDLGDSPHVGEGDRYELEVVTANRLLALLEARELDLRRRFEQIVTEMTNTRDSLLRVRSPDGSGVIEPEDVLADVPNTADETASDGDEESQNRRRLVTLLVQRAKQHSERATQEVMGVALSFEDIREELINNRVDTEERKRRLQYDISTPLKQIASTMFPEFDRRLEQLESSARESAEFAQNADEAIAHADGILAEMERVLEKMLDLESYNEMVDLVRSLIQQQDDLSARTKKLQKKQALDLLK